MAASWPSCVGVASLAACASYSGWLAGWLASIMRQASARTANSWAAEQERGRRCWRSIAPADVVAAAAVAAAKAMAMAVAKVGRA